jgi:hypothetical protein
MPENLEKLMVIREAANKGDFDYLLHNQKKKIF